MSTPQLSGQTAIVTGGAAGIGRAISLRLAAEGATVVVCDIDHDGARQTAVAAPETPSTTATSTSATRRPGNR